MIYNALKRPVRALFFAGVCYAADEYDYSSMLSMYIHARACICTQMNASACIHAQGRIVYPLAVN